MNVLVNQATLRMPSDHNSKKLAQGRQCARDMLAKESKSFALAGLFLSRQQRDDAAVCYAYCRRADDLIDDQPTNQAALALAGLRRELSGVYRGVPQDTPLLAAFAETVGRREIPQTYFDELMNGFEMDLEGWRAPDPQRFWLYTFRVAGVVGLIMCHVLGVKHPRALIHAVHLAVGMQVTNISRDIAEDWQRQRLYVPKLWMQRDESPDLRRPLAMHREGFASALCLMDDKSRRLYASGRLGFADLGLRASFCIDAAGRIYAAIGDVIARQSYNVQAPRAVVSKGKKFALLARALVATAASIPARAFGLLHRPAAATPTQTLRYEDHVRASLVDL